MGGKTDASENIIIGMGRWQMMCVASLGLFSSAALARPEHCSTVHGRYAIYANNDYLSVDGSRSQLIVVIDVLDKKLQKAGWERTIAEGNFVVCSHRSVNPQRLTRHDAVHVKSYSHIRFVSQ